MKPSHSFHTTIRVLTVAAIAATSTANPAFAETQPAPQLLAQVGECRAANRPTPVFESASTVSSALRIVGADQKVTLSAAGANGFVRISSPLDGFIQTAVLKMCNIPPKVGCRLLVKPDFANVRREPKIPPAGAPDNVIGSVAKGETVSVTLSPSGSVITASGDGFIWVQIDASRPPISNTGVGWIYNSRIGVNESNLTVCR